MLRVRSESLPSSSQSICWFSYPVHALDETGVLADIKLDDDKPGWMKAKETRKKNAKEDKKQKLIEFDEAIENANFGEPPSKEDVAEYLGISVKTVTRRLNSSKKYWFDKNSNSIKEKGQDHKKRGRVRIRHTINFMVVSLSRKRTDKDH